MIVVDLDGTLLTCNSFRLFASYLFRNALKKGKVGTTLKFSFWTAARKLNIINHRRLKWQLMKLADISMTENDYRLLAENLVKCINPSVVQFLRGKEWILATAASYEYVLFLSRLIGCKSFIATKRPASGLFKDYRENKGERKLETIGSTFPDSEIDTAITDHLDDLPLLSAAHRRILVNPSKSTLNNVQIQRLNPTIWN